MGHNIHSPLPAKHRLGSQVVIRAKPPWWECGALPWRDSVLFLWSVQQKSCQGHKTTIQIHAFRFNWTIAIVKASREAKPHSTLGCALASHRPKQRTVDLFNTLCCWGCMYAVRLCNTMPPNINFNVMSQTFSLQLYKNLNQVYKRKKPQTYVHLR